VDRVAIRGIGYGATPDPKNRKSFMKIKAIGKIFFRKKNVFAEFFGQYPGLYA
jgi:hypothetical protein